MHCSRLALAVALGAASLAALPAVAHAQESDTTEQLSFELPAGDLARTLQSFSAQTGVQLVYSSDLVAGKRSPGISGQMSPQQALGKLLAGTGLAARVSGNTATLVPAGPSGDVAAVEGERLLGPVRVEGSQGSEYRVPNRGDGIAQLGGVRGGQDEEAEGFRANVATVGTGAQMALEDIPRSITVLTQDQLAKQDVTNLADALQRLPGVTFEEIAPGAGQITARGRPVTRFQIDGGASQNFGNVLHSNADPINFNASALNLDAYERVELVRGSNSVYSGEGSAGGTINLVRKRPGMAPSLSAVVEAGSYGRVGTIVDVSTPSLFGSPIAFRGVASFRREGHEVDHYKTRDFLLYGIFDAPLGDSARLELGFQYGINRTKGQYQGVRRNVVGGLLDLPRDFNLYAPGVYTESTSREAFANLYIDIMRDWDLQIGTSYRDSDSSGVGVSDNILFLTSSELYFPATLRIVRERESSAYRKPSQLGFEAKLTGRFETFGLTHNIYAAIDRVAYDDGIAREFETFLRADINSVDDLLDPQYVPVAPGTSFIRDTFYKRGFRTDTGIVISDTVSWHDIATLGATFRRDIADYERISIAGFDGLVGEWTGTIPPDPKPTWRPSFSATLKPTQNITLFGSYADGFARQTGFYSRSGTAPNYTYAELLPSTFKNKEVGIKYANNGLVGSLSYYKSRQTGVAVSTGELACPPGGAAGIPSFCYVPEAKSISKGVDVEISGRIFEGFDIVANYNYNKNRSSSDSSVPIVTHSPQSSANLFIDWKPSFMRDISFQIGARYKSKYFASGFRSVLDEDGNEIGIELYEVKQSPYIVADIGVEYRASEKLALKFLVENITNKSYFSTVGTNTSGGSFYGRPRSFMASVRWRKSGAQPTDGLSPTTGLAPFGDPADWYAAFDAGLNLTGDFDAEADGMVQDGTETVAWHFETKRNPTAAIRLGYYLTDHFRVEIEGQHRSSTFGSIGGGSKTPTGVCGSQDALVGQPFDCDKVPGTLRDWSIFANILYDFGRRDALFRPFVGAGVGLSRHSIGFQGKMIGIGGDTPWTVEDCFPDFGCFTSPDFNRQMIEGVAAADTRTSLTWQVMAGGSLKISDRLRLDAAWRVANVPGMKWSTYNLDETGAFGAEPLTPRIGTFSTDYRTHMFTLGVRWAFGR